MLEHLLVGVDVAWWEALVDFIVMGGVTDAHRLNENGIVQPDR